MSLFITELFNNCEQYQEKRIEKGYLTQEMKKGKRCEEAEDHKDDCVCVYIYTHTHIQLEMKNLIQKQKSSEIIRATSQMTKLKITLTI